MYVMHDWEVAELEMLRLRLRRRGLEMSKNQRDSESLKMK